MGVLAQLLDDVVIHKFALEKPQLLVGRHPDSDIVIDDGAVSARHARLVQQANADFPDYQEMFIEDLDSTNGTYVNEEKINEPRKLQHEDIIRVAWNKFKYLNVTSPEGKKLEHTLHMVSDGREGAGAQSDSA